jgi:acyl-[acyl-carrier-protein]-phospholipid O-acyltransferase/long-chain-fatty-acid--[acyl-carrier-protein] ligase
MLLIRGPNVMSGYINGGELTGKVLVDGWYVTGDIASVDADGFLKIKRRQIAPPAGSGSV